MGQPLRKSQITNGSASPAKAADGPRPIRHKAASTPRKGWSRQDWLIGIAAALVTMSLVALAILQVTPPEASRRTPRPDAAKRHGHEPEAAPGPAPAVGEAEPAAAGALAIFPALPESPENAASDRKRKGSNADRPADPVVAATDSAVALPEPVPTAAGRNEEAAAAEAQVQAALNEPDDYDEIGADDFVCPVSWLQQAKVADRISYLNSVQTLLKTGWDTKPGALEAARKLFEAGNRLCGDDPRLEYAFGLVLWNHDRRDEARRMWDAATREGPQPFLPALSVVAWGALLEHDAPSGFSAIERAADAVVRTAGDYPTAAQRSHAVLFLGRAIGYLKGPGRSPDLIEGVLETERKLLAGLPADLRQTFEQGAVQAVRRFDDLRKLASRPEADVLAELKREQTRIADETKELRSQVKRHEERRRQIPREMKAHLARLSQESADLEPKMAQRGFNIQQGQAMAYQLSLPRQIPNGYETKTETYYETVRDRDGDVRQKERTREVEVQKYRNETAAEVNARLGQRTVVVAKVNEESQALALLQTRYNAIPQERADTTRAALNERAEIVKQVAVARRRISELMAQDLELRKEFTTPAQIRERMSTLAAYVPWTPESDRDGLAASYRKKPAAPPPKKK